MLLQSEERGLPKNEKLVRIPNRSILSETIKEVCNRTQTDLQKNVVRKKVETIQVTDFIHQRIEEADKENAEHVVVYHSDKGIARHAWNSTE